MSVFRSAVVVSICFICVRSVFAKDALSDSSLEHLFNTSQKRMALLAKSEAIATKLNREAPCEDFTDDGVDRRRLSADWLTLARLEVDLFNLNIRKNYLIAVETSKKAVRCDSTNIAAVRLLRELQGD